MQEEALLSIAIDGPAGAGKTTIAKETAKCLNICYIDTGAMYRAVALKALRLNLALDDENAIVSFLSDTVMDLCYDHHGIQHLILDGVDETEAIRTNEVSKGASAVALLPGVRKAMVALQRELAKGKSVVMDGRDIGTVVLPHATHKFYVQADAKVRAQRRYRELKQKNIADRREQAEILQEIIERDTQDKKRVHSPLQQAEDAVLIDTTRLSIKEAVDVILSSVCQSRGPGDLNV